MYNAFVVYFTKVSCLVVAVVFAAVVGANRVQKEWMGECIEN